MLATAPLSMAGDISGLAHELAVEVWGGPTPTTLGAPPPKRVGGGAKIPPGAPPPPPGAPPPTPLRRRGCQDSMSYELGLWFERLTPIL